LNIEPSAHVPWHVQSIANVDDLEGDVLVEINLETRVFTLALWTSSSSESSARRKGNAASGPVRFARCRRVARPDGRSRIMRKPRPHLRLLIPYAIPTAKLRAAIG
jgi:hypothetical protein